MDIRDVWTYVTKSFESIYWVVRYFMTPSLVFFVSLMDGTLFKHIFRYILADTAKNFDIVVTFKRE